MSNCRLKLTLDRADQAYHFDEVTGTVEVSVDGPFESRGLIVEREWRTHGRGNRDSEKHEEPKLFEGTWQPGQNYRYPFGFTAPNGPVTYHGHDLNVDWYVRARADIPWAEDPKAEQEILLVPPEPPVEGDVGSDLRPTNKPVHNFNLGPSYQAPGAEDISEKIVPGTPALVGGIILLALGLTSILAHAVLRGSIWAVPMSVDLFVILGGGVVLFSLAFSYSIFTDANPLQLQGLGWFWLQRLKPGPGKFAAAFVYNTMFLLLGLVFLWLAQAIVLGGAALVLFAFYPIFRGIRQRKLGPVAIQIRPVVARRGGAITCALQIRQSQTGTIPPATATLLAQEIVESGSCTRRTTYTHVAYEKSFPLAPARHAGRGNGVALEALLTVPSDAPITFASRQNKLVWTLSVRVQNWTPSYPVTVCS